MLVLYWSSIRSIKCLYYGNFKGYHLKKTHVAKPASCYPKFILPFFPTWTIRVLCGMAMCPAENSQFPNLPCSWGVLMGYSSCQWDGGGSLWGWCPFWNEKTEAHQKKALYLFTFRFFSCLECSRYETWRCSKLSWDHEETSREVKTITLRMEQRK